MAKYKKGNIIKVKVNAIEPYGAFVKVDDIYTGLIHISEITGTFINNINDYFNINDVIFARILEVDDEKKHIKMSLKGLPVNSRLKNEYLKETALGFELLNDLLPKWMDDKLNEIDRNKINTKNN